jgi:hypothetical protein
VHKETGLVHSYTLECNYHSGRRINHLSQKLNKLTGEIENETPITDSSSKIYSESGGSPAYSIEIFEDVGKAVCLGILDFIGKNPISRLPLSNFKSIEAIKKDLLS